jgi:hypothetical protein
VPISEAGGPPFVDRPRLINLYIRRPCILAGRLVSSILRLTAVLTLHTFVGLRHVDELLKRLAQVFVI